MSALFQEKWFDTEPVRSSIKMQISTRWKIVVTTGGIFLGFFLGFLWRESIDLYQKFQTAAEVLTSISVAIALWQYFYQKEKDWNVAVIDQIAFFRTEVLPAADRFIDHIRGKKGVGYRFPRIKLDIPEIKYAKEHYREESSSQAHDFEGLDSFVLQNAVLNSLEELALRILHSNTLNHPALDSIKPAFVEIVEINAVTLLIQRELLSGGDVFSKVLVLYSMWKDKVDRRTLNQRWREIQVKLTSNA